MNLVKTKIIIVEKSIEILLEVVRQSKLSFPLSNIKVWQEFIHVQ